MQGDNGYMLSPKCLISFLASRSPVSCNRWKGEEFVIIRIIILNIFITGCAGIQTVHTTVSNIQVDKSKNIWYSLRDPSLRGKNSQELVVVY